MRQAAVQALVSMGAPAVEPLIAALKDKDDDVRQAVAEVLQKIGWCPQANETGALYWIAKQEWDKCVQIGAPAVGPLIAALEDANWRVRKGAAEALGQIGDPRAVKRLTAALKDEHSGVRQAAAEALGGIGDARAVEPLVTALKDKYYPVRKAAAEALGKLDWQLKCPHCGKPAVSLPAPLAENILLPLIHAPQRLELQIEIECKHCGRTIVLG